MAVNPANIELDVGLLWVASIGTTEPTGNMAAQAGPIAGFRQVGYTDKGTTMMPYKPTIVPIFVEEEYYPIRYATTQVEGAVDFAGVEMTRTNLALACNAGANAVNDTSTFQPGVPGSELPIMLMWESATNGERWLFRSCVQIGALSIVRQKAPNKSALPMSFALQKPVGAQPWAAFPAATTFLI